MRTIAAAEETLVIRGVPADCRSGWYPLIRRLDADLSKIDPDYRVDQIKEKFGGLRFYADPQTRGADSCAFEARIDAAEAESLGKCETCGANEASTRTSGDGWVRTRCKTCLRS